MAVRTLRAKHKVDLKDCAPDLEVLRVIKARRVDPTATVYDAVRILAEKSDSSFDAYLVQWKNHPNPTWVGKEGATAKLVAESFKSTLCFSRSVRTAIVLIWD